MLKYDINNYLLIENEVFMGKFKIEIMLLIW